MFYYCTCKKEDVTEAGPYRQVKADKDSICLDCGHYAVAYTKDQKNLNLFGDLRIEKEETENYYVGEGEVHSRTETFSDKVVYKKVKEKKKKGRKSALSPEQQKQALELLKTKSYSDVAAEFKVTKSAIANLVKYSGIKRTPLKPNKKTGAFSPEQVRYIREQAKNRSYRSIGKELNVNYRAISSIVRRLTYSEVE